MKTLLWVCVIVVASSRVQAQFVDTGLQQVQQAIQDSQPPPLPRQCALSSTPANLAAVRSGNSFAQFHQFDAQQVRSLTAPLQTSLYVLNIPRWSAWQVVPLSNQIVLSAKPGVVKPGTKVRIRWRDRGNEVAVYYTTDGWSPNPTSTPYKDPITINGPTHLQVIQLGWKSGPGGCVMRTRSQVLDAYYDVATSGPATRNPNVVTDGLLHQGTVLKLITDAAVDSHLAKVGDKVPLLLDQDVTVGDTVVIPRGTPVEAVLAEAIDPQTSPTAGMLVVAVRSLDKAGTSIELHGVETMEGRPGRASKEAIIEPGMSLQAVVTSDVKLKL